MQLSWAQDLPVNDVINVKVHKEAKCKHIITSIT